VLLIPGNSGCSVEIITRSSKTFVKKSTSNNLYIPRLKMQLEKQIAYKDILSNLENMSTPSVIKTDHKDGHFSFSMEYKGLLDCITFLSISGKKDIDRFFNSILNLINYEIKHSAYSEDKIGDFLSKYDITVSEIYDQKLISNSLLSKIDKAMNSHSKMKIPIGLCHGDLTFSNMLIGKNAKEICLIDFLDNFVESPLQDMVKVRQDTRFFWTSRMSNGCFDRTRNNIVMSHLDSKFHNAFKRHEFYNEFYKSFQILNILRIFRYTSDRNTIDYLVKCLECMVKI